MADEIRDEDRALLRKLAEAVARGRAEGFTEAIAACKAELLIEELDNDGDIAYNKAINDCMAAIERMRAQRVTESTP